MMKRINLPMVLFSIGMIFIFLATAFIEENPIASVVCVVVAAGFVMWGNAENGGRDDE